MKNATYRLSGRKHRPDSAGTIGATCHLSCTQEGHGQTFLVDRAFSPATMPQENPGVSKLRVTLQESLGSSQHHWTTTPANLGTYLGTSFDVTLQS